MSERQDGYTPAALYARVSSDRQDVDLSVAAQLRALRDYAERNGYLVAREYVDEAESGRTADRPQFRRMLEEATRHNAPFHEILVWKFSRFTRKRELAGNLFDVYRRALTGIWQGTPRDAVDPEGPQWLRAGSREYLTSQVLRAPGPESCDPTRSHYARFSKAADIPLSDAETQSGYESMRSARQHSFLAVELLAEQAGQESIMGYFASLRTGVTWQEAFQTNFGMTVAEFYQLFEERRAAGFLEPGSPESADGKMSAPGPFDHLLQDPSLPPFIRWDVESTVDSRDVEAAIWGVKLMGELQQSLGLPDSEVPINIVIYKDMEKMACNYAIAVGWDLETSRKYWANADGVSGRGNIYLRASTPQRLRTEPNLLMPIMVHELTHAHFQAGISGLMTDLSEHSRGSTEVPRWLVEGTAMLVTAMLLRENYPEIYYQHERFRAEQASNALATGLTLRDSETWPPSEGGGVGMDEAGLNIVACIYDCGYFAAELLASRVGVGKLFDYYLLLEPWMTPGGSEEDFPRPGWRLAFEKAYDMTVEEFYDLFEEHRAAGFPDPEGPTPTATPKPEPVVHPSDILDWFDGPPDEAHSYAAKSIERMWDLYPDLAAGVARLIWVGDGITWNEEFVLEELSYVVSEDPELVRAVVNQEHRSYLLEVGSWSGEQAADYAWLADDVDVRELRTIIGIAVIAKDNPSFSERVWSYSWLADGITEAEARGLGALSRWALLAPELVDRVLKYSWLDDGITDAENDTLSVLYSFAERGGVEAAKQVMDYQWLADGVTWEEVSLIAELESLVADDPEAARQISRGTLEPYLLGVGFESANEAADYPWLADGVNARELRTVVGIALIAQKAQELAERLLGYTWLADGVSQRESNGISTLADIAHVNLELARQVVGMGILDDPLRDRDLHAITSLRRLIETDDLALLTSQPWFTDGLSDEETAFLVVTNRDQHSDSQYRDFLRTHFTRSATISLPLAGDVDVWVFWHNPFPDSDDTIELIEDAARASEALMGVPFPTTDIILLIADVGSIFSSGYNAGNHMAMERILGDGNNRGVVYHETAHYYNMGLHTWLNEGFANLMEMYTRDGPELQGAAERKDYLEEHIFPTCGELGFTNIQQLVIQGDYACSKDMGEHFLISLFELLGEEATSAALRELYLMSGEQGEEDFYRVFLKHTLLGLEDEFRDLYGRLHGGPYADAEK